MSEAMRTVRYRLMRKAELIGRALENEPEWSPRREPLMRRYSALVQAIARTEP